MVVSTRGSRVKGSQGVKGYLLGSRERMVETGHIGHYGFLIGTSRVDNVYGAGEQPGVLCTRTETHTLDTHTHTHTHTLTQTAKYSNQGFKQTKTMFIENETKQYSQAQRGQTDSQTCRSYRAGNT